MIKYILNKKNTLQAKEIESPIILNDEEALIKIGFVCLCGSDYKLFREEYSGPVNYPLILGHEWSGMIVDIKSQRNNFKIGDLVTGDCSGWGDNCSLKWECNYNKNTCPQVEKFGITKDGALCNYAVIPVHNLYKAPNDMPLSYLALSELFAVAQNSIKKSNIFNTDDISCKQYNSSSRILITGLGAVGISIYLLLKYKYNMNNVDLYDTSTERRDYLHLLFPDLNFVDNIVPDNSNTYHSLLNVSPYYCIFEASGSEKSIQNAINIINPNGTIVLVGMYPVCDFNIKNIVLKSLTLTGSIGGTGSFPEVIEFLYNNQVVAQKVLSHSYDFNLEDILRAFNTDSLNFIKKIIKVS